MQAAYHSGDPYLEFGKQAGSIPPHATKSTHGPERGLFKQCVLAVNYCMGERALADRLGQPVVVARGLLETHKRVYRQFWQWADGVVDFAMLRNVLWTKHGWPVRLDTDPNPRFLQNFLMQGNGSDMMRLAACLATEAGVRVAGPVHDAFLIVADSTPSTPKLCG